MKRPRFTLRTLMIAVAVIAAELGVVRASPALFTLTNGAIPALAFYVDARRHRRAQSRPPDAVWVIGTAIGILITFTTAWLVAVFAVATLVLFTWQSH